VSLATTASKNLIIGQDFLTWLWFLSEQDRGQWRTQDGAPFGLTFEERVMVQSGEGESLETAVCSGPGAKLHEARTGLVRGKKVQQAKLRLEEDGHEWRAAVKAEDFSLGGFKTPKVEFRLEEGQDPDGPFLEKMYLLERALSFFDLLFVQFMKLRFSNGWSEELQAMRRWLVRT